MKKILIVEDDEFLKQLASRALSEKGYEVTNAVDGVEALKILKDITPDLVLLDLLLPKMSGFEVLRQMRENSSTKNVPVIVFSNLSDEKDIIKAQNFGITTYMVKSNFTIDELIEKVREVVV